MQQYTLPKLSIKEIQKTFDGQRALKYSQELLKKLFLCGHYKIISMDYIRLGLFPPSQTIRFIEMFRARTGVNFQVKSWTWLVLVNLDIEYG